MDEGKKRKKISEERRQAMKRRNKNQETKEDYGMEGQAEEKQGRKHSISQSWTSGQGQ